jgi:hypothetical protein
MAGSMKPGRAFSLLTGAALLAAIAEFNEMPPEAQASLLGDAAGMAHTTVQALLSNVAVTYNEVAGNTAQPILPALVAGRGTGGGNAASPPVAARAEPPSGNPLWAMPLKQLSATRERPIFSPSRRPPPPAPAVVAQVAVQQPIKPPEPERLAVSLLGTIIGAGDDRMAIFLDLSTKGVLRLRIGEDYHGWVVRLIEPRQSILVKGGSPAMVLELGPPGAAPPARSGQDALLDVIWKVGAD